MNWRLAIKNHFQADVPSPARPDMFQPGLAQWPSHGHLARNLFACMPSSICKPSPFGH